MWTISKSSERIVFAFLTTNMHSVCCRGRAIVNISDSILTACTFRYALIVVALALKMQLPTTYNVRNVSMNEMKLFKSEKWEVKLIASLQSPIRVKMNYYGISYEWKYIILWPYNELNYKFEAGVSCRLEMQKREYNCLITSSFVLQTRYLSHSRAVPVTNLHFHFGIYCNSFIGIGRLHCFRTPFHYYSRNIIIIMRTTWNLWLKFSD